MTMTNESIKVSRATLRRLPVYHVVLKKLRLQGREHVSCRHIADDLHIDQTQVRKDLAATGIVGRPRIGYPLADLIGSIESFLGWNNASDALLVGTGNLGTALLGFRDGFEQRGVRIITAFDNNPDKIGREIQGMEVRGMESLPDLARRLNIHLGIICTPSEAAQEIADLMVHSGLRAIWNLAPIFLELPDDVVVENTQLSSSLAVLSGRLAAQLGG